jgi:cell division protein FtsB
MDKVERKRFYVVIALFVLLLYVTYHVMSGSRGILSMLRVRSTLAEKQELLQVLQHEQEELEHQVGLLQPGKYDLDLLDELAREYFGLRGLNEKVIMLDVEKEQNR